MSALVLEIEVDGVLRRVSLERQGESYVAQLDGRAIPVDICEPMPGVLSLLIGDDDARRAYRCIRTVYADEESIALIGHEHRAVACSQALALRA